MILTFCLLTLLVVTNTGAQRIKGGPRIIQEPAIQEPHIHVGKGGGGGAKLHHTAVVADPISSEPVVVEKFTDLGPSSGQFSISDAQISSFGQRRLYRVGQSQVPFGLSGLDYYSFPSSLLSARRVLRRKTVATDNVSGLSPIGFGARKSAIIADPTTSQFTVGDSQIRTSAFGGRGLYRTGISSVPFGLSGLDYYSYPNSLRSLLGGGLGQTQILSGGGFTAGDAQISGLAAGPIGQEEVTIVESAPAIGGFGTRKSAIIADPTTSQFTVGDAQIRTSAFGGRGLYRTGISSVPFGLSGLDYYSYPRSLGSILGGGLGQTQILSGGGFTAGDAQISGLGGDPIGQEKVTIVESAPAVAAPAIVQATQEPEQITTIVEDGGFGQRQVTTVTRPAGGLRGGNIILRGGPAAGLRRVKSRPVIQAAAPVQEVQVLVDSTSGLGAPIGGFGQRQVVTKTVAPAPAPVVVAPAPAPIISAPVFQAPAPVFATPIRRRLGEAFLTHAARPLVAARRIATIARPVSIAQAPAFPGHIQFTLGNTQIIGGGPSFAPAPIVAAPAPRQVVIERPVVAARPVVAVQRPAVVLQSPVSVKRPVVAVQQPVISQVKTSGFGARVIARQFPQMYYVDGGSRSRFPGIDIIGGYRIGDPRYNYGRLPISTSSFANLGLSQASIDSGPVLVAPAPVPSFGTKTAPIAKTAIAPANTLGLTAVGHTSPTKIVTQEEVVGPAGDTQIVTTVTDAGPSKIGGPVIGGGLAGVGQTKTITQEEVIGPSGEPQVVTTVTKSAPSKIGGAAIAAPLGLAAVGQSAPTQVVTQEEVIGPAGDSQIVTTVTNAAPSKIGGPVVSSPLGLAAVGKTSPAKVVTQEEVIGPAGDRQVVTTVTDAGPSKIGGPAVGGPLGLTGIGQPAVTKTVTQEEVIGPAGDSQVITTVTETAAAPSKIGGPVAASPLGLTAVGQAPTKVITQEEVVGPSGDTQVITTVQETSPIVQQEEVGISSLTASPFSQEITQDPIETVLSQETLGDSTLGAAPVVQQSISSGFDGGLGGGYVPRVSFLSQFPYDVPARSLLRQALTRPIVQEQQQLEQILV